MKSRILPLLLSAVMLLALAVPCAANSEVKTAAAPIGVVEIDGVIDDVWSKVEPIPVTILKTGTYANNASIDASMYAELNVKILWDGFNVIYLLFEVKDKVVATKSETAYMNDSVEFYIDEKNEKAASFDTNDHQFRIEAKEGVYENLYDNIDKAAVKFTSDGYIIETEYYFTAVNPTAGMSVGLELQLNDDAEGNGERNVCLGWNDSKDIAYSDPSVWGNLNFSGAVVGETKESADTLPAPENATKDGELVDITKLSDPNMMTYTVNSDGSATFKFKDSIDPYITIGVSSSLIVNAEEYPYFAMYLKTNDWTTGQMFYSTSGGATAWHEEYSTTIMYEEVEGNQITVIDFTGCDLWEGDVVKLRFDVFSGGPEDYESSEMTLYAAGFFKTEEAAYAFAVDGVNVELDPELTQPAVTTPAATEEQKDTTAVATDKAETETDADVPTSATVTNETKNEQKNNYTVPVIIGAVVLAAIIVVVVVLIVKKKKK